MQQVYVGAVPHAAFSMRTLEGQIFCISGTNHMEVDTAVCAKHFVTKSLCCKA